MEKLHWKEVHFEVPDNDGKTYTLHLKYMPSELDELLENKK